MTGREGDHLQDIVVLGAGGHARSVVDSIQADATRYRVVGFVDGNPEAKGYRGIPVLGDDGILSHLAESGIRHAHVAIGFLGGASPRRCLHEALWALGFDTPPIIDPSAAVALDAAIGSGAFVGKLAVVNSCAQVGPGAIINTAGVVEHDAMVGAFSHLATGAVLCGGASVGDETLVGAHATVLQGVSIGDGCMVGAAALVREDVVSAQRAIGIPARTEPLLA